ATPCSPFAPGKTTTPIRVTRSSPDRHLPVLQDRVGQEAAAHVVDLTSGLVSVDGLEREADGLAHPDVAHVAPPEHGEVFLDGGPLRNGDPLLGRPPPQ